MVNVKCDTSGCPCRLSYGDNLRKQFEDETGTKWENSQGEPDIDYVGWIENKLSQIDPEKIAEEACSSYFIGIPHTIEQTEKMFESVIDAVKSALGGR